MLNPKKDERRPLDEEGILQSRYVGRLLAGLDVQVDQIISSPLKRARQTASLVANELAFEQAVQLEDALRPFTRCRECNALLEDISRDAVPAGLAPPRVLALYDAFRRCAGCGRVYWPGSHYARMSRLLESVAARAAQDRQSR